MKKFILLLGVLALGFTSCSKKSENLKVIPKDAMVVVSFDLQEFPKTQRGNQQRQQGNG